MLMTIELTLMAAVLLHVAMLLGSAEARRVEAVVSSTTRRPCSIGRHAA